MKALAIRASALLLLAGPFFPIGAAEAADTVLRSFPAGEGSGSVGVAVSRGGEDTEDDGPQALTSDDQGQIFVLDQVNNRILKLDPANPAAPPQALALPPGVQPTDLVVKKDAIYIWDGKIHTLSPLGPATAPTRGLAETRSGEPVGDAVRTAFAQMGSDPDGRDDPDAGSTRAVTASKPALPKSATPGHQEVDTASHGTVSVDVAITDKGSGAQLKLQADNQPPLPKLALKVPGRLGTIAFLNSDKTGRFFVLAEDVPESMSDSAFAFVARYSAKGALEGVYELPLDQTVGVSRRAVTVSPDGDVYFLKTYRKGADVIGLGFRPMANAKLIALGRPKSNVASVNWNDASWVGMAVGPLTRERILKTAVAFRDISWTAAPSNYGPEEDKICSGFNGRIRRPMYMIGKEAQQVQGVPYCWGCQGSLPQFMSRIQKGTLAGNVCTKENPRPDVAGVDCSSFVSATWGLSTHFTTAAIPAIAQQIANPWDLKPGDALDKPGSHVVLFVGFTPDRQAKVIEASPGACQGRVCQNTYPLSSLLSRGFIPVRYRALVETSDATTKQSSTQSIAQ